VTAHPTAEWISRQLTEAYGWKVAPRYIIRDRDRPSTVTFFIRPPSGDGHSGSADRAAIAVAERVL